MSNENCTIRHHRQDIAGVEIYWGEAGDPQAPAIVLLSRHLSGAHAYNGLIERLAGSWRVVAPDYPGYGFSATPPMRRGPSTGWPRSPTAS